MTREGINKATAAYEAVPDSNTEEKKKLWAAVVEEHRKFLAAKKPSKPAFRRHELPQGECSYCDSQLSSFHPPHDASPNCKSGGHTHCSCDTCF